MPPKINQKYVPKSLSASDKKKQITSIKNKTNRPKVKYESKRSSWVSKFEKKYKTKINDTSYISKNIISKTGIDKIMSKGRGAYYNAGSRPNQTSQSWALSRLASVILNGPARKVDNDIWNKYKI
jgi:hypothetical protein